MELAESIYGVLDHLGGKSMLASIINKAGTSTLPIGLEDVISPALFEDVTVQFFKGSLHLTISSGCVRPRGSVIVTANQAFRGTQK